MPSKIHITHKKAFLAFPIILIILGYALLIRGCEAEPAHAKPATGATGQPTPAQTTLVSDSTGRAQEVTECYFCKSDTATLHKVQFGNHAGRCEYTVDCPRIGFVFSSDKRCVGMRLCQSKMCFGGQGK